MNGILRNVFIFFILIGVSCQTTNHDALTLAVASNIQGPSKELIDLFNKKASYKVGLIVSSSGKLAAQIVEGAPYDIFISADMKYPKEIQKQGLALSAPKVFSYGKLVLWSMIIDEFDSIPKLLNPSIDYIAFPNPSTAPYGVAAVEVLNHYDLYDSLKEKFVFGESITQVNQFIISKSATIGFTSLSTVLSSEMEGKGYWVEIDPKLYSPIEQGIVMIKHDNSDKKAVNEFYEFLFSEEAKDILKKYGYSINE